MKKERFVTGVRRLCCLLLALCASASAQEAPELLEPAGVQMNVAEAYIGSLSEITPYEASVIPWVEEFFFEQEGVVDQMHVVPGQAVRAGDPLITLDTEAEEKRVSDIRREMERIEANGRYEDELAAIDLDILNVELRALLKQTPRDEDAVILKQLEMEEKQLEAELAVSLRELSLQQLGSELEQLEKDIAQNVLYAPFDGTVLYMTSQLMKGSYVSAYSPLIYLADDTRLFVESEYISSYTLETAHRVYALVGDGEYEITLQPVDQEEYLSRLLAGETLMLQFAFDAPDEKLAAGQYAVVCVESNYVDNALLVPSNALYSDDSRYLYVLEDGVRVRRNVQTGVRTDWLTQITGGLEEGELVYVKE